MFRRANQIPLSGFNYLKESWRFKYTGKARSGITIGKKVPKSEVQLPDSIIQLARGFAGNATAPDAIRRKPWNQRVAPIRSKVRNNKNKVPYTIIPNFPENAVPSLSSQAVVPGANHTIVHEPPQIINAHLVAPSKWQQKKSRKRAKLKDWKSMRLPKSGCYMGNYTVKGTHFVKKSQKNVSQTDSSTLPYEAQPTTSPTIKKPKIQGDQNEAEKNNTASPIVDDTLQAEVGKTEDEPQSQNPIVQRVLGLTSKILATRRSIHSSRSNLRFWVDCLEKDKKQANGELLLTLRERGKLRKPLYSNISSSQPAMDDDPSFTVSNQEVYDGLQKNEMTVEEILQSTNLWADDTLLETRRLLAKKRKENLDIRKQELDQLKVVNKKASELGLLDDNGVLFKFTAETYPFPVNTEFITRPDVIDTLGDSTVPIKELLGRNFKIYEHEQSDIIQKVREAGEEIKKGKSVLAVTNEIAPYTRKAPTSEEIETIERIGNESKTQLALLEMTSPLSDEPDPLFEEISKVELFKNPQMKRRLDPKVSPGTATHEMPKHFSKETLEELSVRSDPFILQQTPAIECLNGLFHYGGPERIANHPIQALRRSPAEYLTRHISFGLIRSSIMRRLDVEKDENESSNVLRIRKFPTTAKEAADIGNFEFEKLLGSSEYCFQPDNDANEEDALQILATSKDATVDTTVANKQHGVKAVFKRSSFIPLSSRSAFAWTGPKFKPEEEIHRKVSELKLRRKFFLERRDNERPIRTFVIDVAKLVQKVRRDKSSRTRSRSS